MYSIVLTDLLTSSLVHGKKKKLDAIIIIKLQLRKPWFRMFDLIA